MENDLTTRQRLIKAASRIFAEKGYRNTTVAEICEAADANIAAVNYHFGDKESLYDACWRHVFELAASTYPIDGGLSDNPSFEDILIRYASAILHRIFCEDDAGLFSKLLHQEMSNPTLALEKIASDALFPQSQYMGKAIRSELGPYVDEEHVRLCMHSIVGQCAFYNFSRGLRERVLGMKGMTEEEIESIARHIARFSMGGLNAVKQENT